MKLSDNIDEFNAAMQEKYGRYYILAALTPDERKHALQLAEQTPDKKQAHAHKTIKQLETLRNRLWKARDELSHFGVLTDAMGALNIRVGSADQKAQLAKSQIDDAIYDLNSEIKRIETAAGWHEDEILQCQMCGCTLEGTGLDQQKEYVCEDCRARNPTHLPDNPTAQIA